MERIGVDFRLVVLGESSRTRPTVFDDARSRFRAKMIHYGYAPGKAAYTAWLKKGYVAVSTAIQENFGIAVVEAMRHGCLPLLPRRLAYPEILPREFHRLFLYDDEDDLVRKLAAMLRQPSHFSVHRPVLAQMMARNAWTSVIDRYDRELDMLAADKTGGQRSEDR